MADNYGDFQEVADETTANGSAPNGETPGVVRVRLPRGKEKIGVILQRFGGNKMDVMCSDGKKRNCRVPGRFSRSLWLRPKDHVLVEPWEFDDTKADVIFKYEGNAVSQLRKRGLLNNLKDEF